MEVRHYILLCLLSITSNRNCHTQTRMARSGHVPLLLNSQVDYMHSSGSAEKKTHSSNLYTFAIKSLPLACPTRC